MQLLINDSAKVKRSGATPEIICLCWPANQLLDTFETVWASVWHRCQSNKPLWTLIVLTADKGVMEIVCRYGSLLCKTLILTLDLNITWY